MTARHPLTNRIPAWARKLLAHWGTHVLLGLIVLFLDLKTGPYVLFPILFVVPVTLSAWYWGFGWSGVLALMLPLGRLLIAHHVDHQMPLAYSVLNAVIRIGVLLVLAYLVAHSARQTRQLQEQIAGLVTICAWSRTVQYQGEWLSFEDYLQRRFGISTSHGISPAEADKAMRDLHRETGSHEQG